jgi:hypothetical protein
MSSGDIIAHSRGHAIFVYMESFGYVFVLLNGIVLSFPQFVIATDMQIQQAEEL